MEDGSRAGWVFGYLGGFLNMGAMILLIVKVIIFAMASVNAIEEPEYLKYFLYIFALLYLGILGVWIFANAYKMKFSYSLSIGAKYCLILGIFSLNILAVIGGIFGLVDAKQQEKESSASDLSKITLNPSFGQT